MVKLAPPTLRESKRKKPANKGQSKSKQPKAPQPKPYQPGDEPDLPLEPGTNYGSNPNLRYGAPQFHSGTAPIIFDIETGPLDDETVLSRIKPFPPMEEPEDIGSFDVNAVKLGNLKDEAKIKAKQDEARAEHNRKRKLGPKLHEEKYLADKAEYEARALEKAALRAETGRVVAIGYAQWEDDARYAVDGLNVSPGLFDYEESNMLISFWRQYEHAVVHKTQMIGHNISGFDLPFLVRRSWLLGVKVPDSVVTRNRFWNDIFVDTGESWLCGQRGDQPWSLDYLSLCFGGEGKLDGVNGSDFARLWKDNRDLAIGYLMRDLDMTYFVATKLGIAG